MLGYNTRLANIDNIIEPCKIKVPALIEIGLRWVRGRRFNLLYGAAGSVQALLLNSNTAGFYIFHTLYMIIFIMYTVGNTLWALFYRP